MVEIRVTRGGCGISYVDEYGIKRHALKTIEDGPFLCDAGQAERLVRLGVAVYVTAKGPEGIEEEDSGQAPGSQQDHRLNAEELGKWGYDALKALADDMGIKPNGRKKTDYIEAIISAGMADGDLEEDEAPPELGAADPE